MAQTTDVPGSGRVLVGGAPVGGLSPGVLREHVVLLVDQEHHVFTGSLRENVAIAGPDADDARLLAALDAVDADWVREMPEGLDTLVGSGGGGGGRSGHRDRVARRTHRRRWCVRVPAVLLARHGLRIRGRALGPDVASRPERRVLALTPAG